jgi:hypothetical protein
VLPTRDAWVETLKDHPEATKQVLDAFHQNLYGPGFLYSVDRAFVSSCQTPCLVLASNDEAHPFAISEETAKLLPNAAFIRKWKTGEPLAAAKVRIKEFLSKCTGPECRSEVEGAIRPEEPQDIRRDVER